MIHEEARQKALMLGTAITIFRLLENDRLGFQYGLTSFQVPSHFALLLKLCNDILLKCMRTFHVHLQLQITLKVCYSFANLNFFFFIDSHLYLKATQFRQWYFIKWKPLDWKSGKECLLLFLNFPIVLHQNSFIKLWPLQITVCIPVLQISLPKVVFREETDSKCYGKNSVRKK